MATRLVIGLAAGSCLAGVDAVLLEAEGSGLDLKVHFRHGLAAAYARETRELLLRACQSSQPDTRPLAIAHRVLGESLAAAACLVADQASTSLQQILCVGVQQLTAIQDLDSRSPARLNLGAPAIVAEHTGLTSISDFCWRDLATGGQGGPESALAYAVLFGSSEETRLLVHLGGLTRVLLVPPAGDVRSVVGWDAGPGNVLLDAVIQQMSGGKERFDVGGRLAVQGRQIPELLEKWLLHPMLTRKPPKSLARSLFAEDFARQAVALAVQRQWNPHDFLCTANHFVARAIADSVKRFLPRGHRVDRVILTGSGVHNGLLRCLLEDLFIELPMETSPEHGIPVEFSQATAAAVMACLTLDGIHGNLPSMSGARGSRLLGQLTPGAPSNWSRCLGWMHEHLSVIATETED
jgi:anhydro-N-acetylmuramic acid kinase